MPGLRFNVAAAKQAAKAMSGIGRLGNSSSANSANGVFHMLGEVAEQAGHAISRNPDSGKLITKETAKAAGMKAVKVGASAGKGAVKAAQYAAGVPVGMVGATVPGITNGIDLVGQVAKKSVTMSETEGIHISNWAGNRLAGAIGLGAAAMTIGSVNNASRSQMATDPEDPTLAAYEQETQRRQHPELHRQALGAHGSLVTQGSRSARKRY